MRFHVARDGAVMGEFEEQVFRDKVFSGEIRPSDWYWRLAAGQRISNSTKDRGNRAGRRVGCAPGNSKAASAFGAGDRANLHQRAGIDLCHWNDDGKIEERTSAT